MKTLWGALALSAGLSLTSLAHAQDCPPTPECPCPSEARADGAPTLAIADDAEEMRQLEAQLNEILLVDETGRITLREEFKTSLPFPAERLEMMLASFTELGDDGRIRLKNPDMIRPYLPMIRGFLSQGGLDKLRALQDLPPEQRREAMRRLMAEQQGQLRPGQDEERAQPAPRPERRPARPDRPERPDRAERPARPQVGPRADILERLERIERSVERIERTLRSTLERHGDQLRGEGEGRRLHRGQGRNRGRMLERMLPRGPEGMLQRGRTYRDGMRKLMELMGPEDTDTLRKAFRALGGDVKPEDLRDPMALLPKLQESLTPEETVRLMEIFSEFIASPEGRAMAEELDDSVERLEKLVNSPEGQRMLDGMRRLQEGRGGARGGERLGERLEQLIRPRRERDRGASRAERPARSAERRHGDRQEPARDPSAKLY